jgi:predicted  nucleic acid-binding Zn-ribbon protein
MAANAQTNMMGAQVVLASVPTNTTPESNAPILAPAQHSVRYQIVPIDHGPYKTASTPSSKNLASTLVFVSTNTTDLPDREFKLGSPQGKQVYFKEDGTEIKNLQAHVVEIRNINAGDSVSLHFARDALSAYRKKKVFELSCLLKDTVITILEKPGLLAEDTTLTLSHETNELIHYTAILSGNTWLDCSPKFTADFATSALSNIGVNDQSVVNAIRSIYANGVTELADKTCELQVNYNLPGGDDTKLILCWPQGAGIGLTANPGQHVQGIVPRLDVPTRTHPRTYSATIVAGIACQLQRINLTNVWRPMLGSCLHRQGESLDIASLVDAQGKTIAAKFNGSTMSPEQKEKLSRLNSAREKHQEKLKELKKLKDQHAALSKKISKAQKKVDEATKRAQKAADSVQSARDAADKLSQSAIPANPLAAKKLLTNISKAAKALEKATQDAQKAQAASVAAAQELKELQEQATTLAETSAETSEELAAAELELAQAEAQWRETVEKADPPAMQQFRAELRKLSYVDDIFDPWHMDGGVQDSTPDAINMQNTGNETLHNNHLHLTIQDPLIRSFDK